VPIQAYFESGFPYGVNQWISAAATAWATTALASPGDVSTVERKGRKAAKTLKAR